MTSTRMVPTCYALPAAAIVFISVKQKLLLPPNECCNAPLRTTNFAFSCCFSTLPSCFHWATVRLLLSQGPELNEEQREQEAQWGPPRGDPTQWASCLRVVDPSTLESASVLELDNNEAALSMCCVRFTGGEDVMLAVGTVQNLGFYPRAADGILPSPCKQRCIIVYVWVCRINALS